MIRKIIVAILTMVFLVTFQQSYAVPEIDDEVMVGFENANSIPDWVDQNFRWYGQGQITQTEILNSLKYLIENEIIIIETSENLTNNPSHSQDWTDLNDSDPGVRQVSPSQTKVIIMAMIAEEQPFANQKIKNLLNDGADSKKWEAVIEDIQTHAQKSHLKISNGEPESVDSVVDELQGIVVLCSTSIDKELGIIEIELELIKQITENLQNDSRMASAEIENFDQSENKEYWIQRLEGINSKTQSIQTGILLLQSKVKTLENSLGLEDNTQLANMELQNSLQKQQQTLQTMSNVSKSYHDTAKAIIQNMRA